MGPYVGFMDIGCFFSSSQYIILLWLHKTLPNKKSIGKIFVGPYYSRNKKFKMAAKIPYNAINQLYFTLSNTSL
jgi:hypothetical protein